MVNDSKWIHMIKQGLSSAPIAHSYHAIKRWAQLTTQRSSACAHTSRLPWYLLLYAINVIVGIICMAKSKIRFSSRLQPIVCHFMTKTIRTYAQQYNRYLPVERLECFYSSGDLLWEDQGSARRCRGPVPRRQHLHLQLKLACGWQ